VIISKGLWGNIGNTNYANFTSRLLDKRIGTDLSHGSTLMENSHGRIAKSSAPLAEIFACFAWSLFFFNHKGHYDLTPQTQRWYVHQSRTIVTIGTKATMITAKRNLKPETCNRAA
jgi:hypothetical protein